MKTAFHIVLRSWKLPWQEKSLLALSLLLFVLVSFFGFIDRIAGLPLLRGILSVCFGGVGVAVALRALAGEDSALRQAFARARQRLVPLILLGILFIILEYSLTFLLAPRISLEEARVAAAASFRWWEYEKVVIALTLVSLLVPMLLALVFLLALPTIIVEERALPTALLRSWALGLKTLGYLLLSFSGLVLTFGLLWAAFIFFEFLVLVFLTSWDRFFAFHLFWRRFPIAELVEISDPSFFRLMIHPVYWSYSALFYQHAAARLDGESPYTPEDDDIDEDAFHKPKA